MDFGRVVAALARAKAERYRAAQVARAVCRGPAASYAEVGVLPEAWRGRLEREAPLLCLSAAALTNSADGTRKAALRLADGGIVESVLMRPSPRRWTACLSCQTGCAVGCGFCATGLLGAGRSLTPEEITDQVLFWRLHMRREGIAGEVSNVVYMGMGEPFLAYDSVAESLRVLTDQRLFGMGARRISVSTAGFPDAMRRFADEFPQVNIALSLHAANDELRARLVPINKAYPLAALAAALREIFARHRRKVFLEYVLLGGVNDSPRQAREVIEFVRSIDPGLLHVNLIVFNATATAFSPPAEAAARAFHAALRAAGLMCTIRQNLGRDIAAACGQLAPAGASALSAKGERPRFEDRGPKPAGRPA